MLSVIIPTHNRPRALHQALAALSRLACVRERIEVIVVDDGGRVPVCEVVSAFHDRLCVRCVRREKAGPAAARNAGARLAEGDWLAFLDDDCQVTPDWLERLRARGERHPGAMIGGGTLNALPQDPYAACHHLLLDYLYARLNPTPDAAVFCASNNLAVPAAHFREIGGFDTGFRFPAGEDRELCDRWRLSGRPLIYAPEVLVQHTHSMTLPSFCRQHFRYGRGAYRLHRLRRERQAGQGWAERPVFYLGLLLRPFRPSPSLQSPALFTLTLVSQLATASGYGTEVLIASLERARG